MTLEHFDENFTIHELDWWHTIAPRFFLNVEATSAEDLRQAVGCGMGGGN